jgi:hypothetical protein
VLYSDWCTPRTVLLGHDLASCWCGCRLLRNLDAVYTKDLTPHEQAVLNHCKDTILAVRDSTSGPFKAFEPASEGPSLLLPPL